MSGKVLLLYGSPKGEKGASANIAHHVIEGMRERGAEITPIGIYRSLDQQEAFDRLVKAFDEADSVVLSFPLYIDTLHAGVCEALTRLYRGKEGISQKRRKLLAICNCGFPESRQCRSALRSCQLFAERMGMEFWGGVAIGNGGMLGGGPSHDGRINVKQTEALHALGKGLNDGGAIPAVAVELLGRSPVPPRMYTFFANMGWNATARKNGVRRKMKARPYQRS